MTPTETEATPLLPADDAPPPARGESVGSGVLEPAIAALLFALGSVVALLRLPSNVRRTVWAEDGAVFLTDALDASTGLLDSYAGYLHFLPRLLADGVVQHLSFRHFAIGVNFAACAAAGLVTSCVYICAEDLIPNRFLRAWTALLTVLSPLVGHEVVANLANVHWYFLWGVFWALLRAPRTMAGAFALGTFVAVGTLTEIQTFLLLPVALYAAYRHRNAKQWLVCLLVRSRGVCADLEHAAQPAPIAAAAHHPPARVPTTCGSPDRDADVECHCGRGA